MHSNGDLLIARTKKGGLYSEAVMLNDSKLMMDRVNRRKYGNQDQKDLLSDKQIKAMKKEGNANFADSTLAKVIG